jgi:uncharacterized OsmC-like protein
MIDEPEIRGGKGTGPTPLGYFVTGAASCLMMQYANVLKEKPMAVESIKMLARAHNDREARVFTDMIYQVDLTESLSDADAETAGEGGKRALFRRKHDRQVVAGDDRSEPQRQGGRVVYAK